LAQLKNKTKLAMDAKLKANPVIPSDLGHGVDMTNRNIGLPVLELTVGTNGSSTAISPTGTVYKIPTGVEYQEILGGLEWPVRNTFLWEHFYDYIYQMFEWSNQDGGYIKPLLKGVSLKDVHDTYFKDTSFMALTQGYYGAYALALAKPAQSFQLEEHAQQAINYVGGLTFNEANKQVFYYFLQNWGTSIITEEVQGGFLQFGCIIQSAIWRWGGQGTVSPDFIHGEADAFFRDKIHGTTYTSTVFTQNSVCNFYCSGGNPEECPTSATAVDMTWPATIWANPQNIKLNVIPITELVSETSSRHNLQLALFSYYSEQMNQWHKYADSCSMCLPTLNSFVIAANVEFGKPTTVKAGTCGTAIRVTAFGSCTFIMTNNDVPINGGTKDCYYTNTAMWGSAAVYSITDPIVEWIVTEVNVDNTFVSAKCDYPNLKCNYWHGHYSVFCV